MTKTKAFSRSDRSKLGVWWWTIDGYLLAAIIALTIIGIVLNFSASPAVAQRIGLDQYHFIKKQLIFLPLAAGVMFLVSLQTPRKIRQMGIILFGIFFIFTVLTLITGEDIKGAKRWLNIFGISIQPSEFLKPCFAIFSAWLLAVSKIEDKFPGIKLSCALFIITLTILLLQPDIGMSALIMAIWGAQIIIYGMPLIFMLALPIVAVIASVFFYFSFPHFQNRIDSFINSDNALTYQIKRSLQAFENGGWFGKGPGEGSIKQYLPDAHTDFILAVAGEEFGIFACLFINLLFAIIVLRGFYLLFKEKNLFIIISVSGLLVQFGLQAIINMASTLYLIPTKGMTLPLISYGGSSLISLAIGIGMILGLLRRREELNDDF